MTQLSTPHRSPRWPDALLSGFVAYLGTSMLVVLGVSAGIELLPAQGGIVGARDYVGRLANVNGEYYVRIAAEGYSYQPSEFSNVAFFPVYPLAGWGLAQATGLRTDAALVLVSQICLLAAFVLLAVYARRGVHRTNMQAGDYTLLAMGLIPTSFFFRMALSEALFLMLVVLVLYGIQQKWNLITVALIVGLATAARPVGVALLPPFALYVWQSLREREAASSTTNVIDVASTQVLRSRHGPMAAALLKTALLTALAAWGIAAFACFCAVEFGDALSFVKAQTAWRLHTADEIGMPRRMLGLLLLEPIWSVYVSNRAEYWQRFEPNASAPFSLLFANAIYFVGTAALVVFGWWKGLLNRYEWLTALFLLLIPYVTRSHDNAMAGFGRFAAVVVPAYLVMGWLLHRIGFMLSALVLAIFALFLDIYSALFAAGYPLM